MICRHCGQQSLSHDICPFCNKSNADGAQPATPPAQPTQAMPNPPVERRVSLTGEVIEVPIERTQPLSPPGQQPTMQMPPGMRPQGYAPGMAPSALSERAEEYEDAPSTGERWEKCLAVLFPLLLGGMLVSRFAPALFIWAALGTGFLVALAMGATRVIPSFEDEQVDVSVILLVSLLIGGITMFLGMPSLLLAPGLTLGAYLMVALVKQECNGAMVALLALSILVPLILAIPFVAGMEHISQIVSLALLNFVNFMMLFTGCAGWMLSSFFRPIGD